MNRKLTSLAVAGVIAVAGLAGASSAGAATACPGQFNVLHNDSIGKLKLPQGPYTISVKRMTCVDASSNFAPPALTGSRRPHPRTGSVSPGATWDA